MNIHVLRNNLLSFTICALSLFVISELLSQKIYAKKNADEKPEALKQNDAPSTASLEIEMGKETDKLYITFSNCVKMMREDNPPEKALLPKSAIFSGYSLDKENGKITVLIILPKENCIDDSNISEIYKYFSFAMTDAGYNNNPLMIKASQDSGKTYKNLKDLMPEDKPLEHKHIEDKKER